MADTCWICLESSGLLERNPPPCTCVSGGWVHRQCMRDYGKSHPARRYDFSWQQQVVTVMVPHVCGVQMPAIVHGVGGRLDFLRAILADAASLGMPRQELWLFVFVAVLVAVVYAPLTTMAAMVLVAALPFAKWEFEETFVMRQARLGVTSALVIAFGRQYLGAVLLGLVTRDVLRVMFIRWLRVTATEQA